MLGNQKVMDFLHRHDFCEGNPIDVILRNNDWMIIEMTCAESRSDVKLRIESRFKVFER